MSMRSEHAARNFRFRICLLWHTPITDPALPYFSSAALVLCMMLATFASPAQAQRSDENAIATAEDAFGASVGLQNVGLYSPTNARGFNPTQAGNLRIEGLFYDQQTATNNAALFSGNEMRIGIAAQTYPFPSPTGIADYKLRIPGDRTVLSAVITHGPFDETTAEFDGQYPLLSEKLSAGLSVLDYQNFDYQAAQRSREYACALLLRYRPTEQFEIVPFYGYIGGGEHRELAFVYADAEHPVPPFQELTLPVQSWSSWGWGQTTAGVIARGRLSDAWAMTAGVFRSVEDDAQNFNDLLIGLKRDRFADHVMDVVPPLKSSSTSGEVRVVHSFVQATHQHELELTVRARQVDRAYGGDSISDLGTTSIDRGAAVSESPLSFSAIDHDNVRQVGVGVNYTERWQEGGFYSAGILKTRYTREIASPAASSAPQFNSPVLPDFRFAVPLGRIMTIYGGYLRGLEDSVVAPTNAMNRGEPPPATLSWQVDGGAKFTISSRLQLLLGYFEIHKPYFNLDGSNEYRQLGEARNQGLEGSAIFNGDQVLRIVAGFVKISSLERGATGLSGVGAVPIGPVPLTINVNADCAPPNWHGWGGSLQWTRLSSRVETVDDRYALSPLSTINAGLRYSAKVLNHDYSVRLDIANLTNATGLTISPLYLVLPQLRRNYMLSAAIDL